MASFSIRQTAQILKKPATTIYRWVKKYDIAFREEGRPLRIDAEGLEKNMSPLLRTVPAGIVCLGLIQP